MFTNRLPADDRGEILSGWLVKLAVTLGILGIIVFDAISCGMTRIRTQDAANNGARVVVDELQQRHNLQVAYTEAQRQVSADNPGYEIDPASITVGQQGEVALKVSGTGSTLVLHYIKPIRHLASATAEGHARPGT